MIWGRRITLSLSDWSWAPHSLFQYFRFCWKSYVASSLTCFQRRRYELKMEHTLTFRCHSNPSGKHQLDAVWRGWQELGIGRLEESQRLGALRLCAPDSAGKAQWQAREGLHFQKGVIWSRQEGLGPDPPKSCSDGLFTASVLGHRLLSVQPFLVFCSRLTITIVPLAGTPLLKLPPPPPRGSSELLLRDSSLRPPQSLALTARLTASFPCPRTPLLVFLQASRHLPDSCIAGPPPPRPSGPSSHSAGFLPFLPMTSVTTSL